MNKTLKRIFENVDKYSPFPFMYLFRMSKVEIELFEKNIKSSKGYLEFGSGGSTFHVLLKSNAKVYSVDSDIQWITKLRGYFFIRFMERRRLTFLFVNIGPIREWGYPGNNDYKNLFPNYSAQVFDLIKKETIDLVLIDGRFRVACALKTILECHKNNNIKILIHDFWMRTHYHIVLKYLMETDRAGTLRVFNIKFNIDINSVKKDYEIYKYISA